MIIMVKTSLGNHIVMRRDVIVGRYAHAIGKTNLALGYKWADSNETFTIALNGADAKTVTLSNNTVNIAAVVAEVQRGINAVFPSSQFTVSAYNTNYVKIVSNEGYFVLVDVLALASMGIKPGNYVGSMEDDYDATATGNENLSDGIDWDAASGEVADFKISLNGATEVTVNLTNDADNIAGVVAEVQRGLDVVAVGDYVVSVFGTNYVRIVTVEANDYFALVDGTATPLADMGLVAQTYYGNDLISAPKGDVVMPYEGILREAIHVLNMGASERTIMNKGRIYKDGSLPLYVQDDNFLRIAMEGDRSDQLDTFTLHWQSALGDHESYGCQIKQIELTWSVDEWAEQAIECQNTESWETDVVTFATDDGFLPLTGNTMPLAWYDISTTIDGNDVDITEAAFRVIMEGDFDSRSYVGNEIKDNATLDKRMYEVDITFKSNSEALRQLVDLKASTLHLMDVVIVLGFASGDKTLTLANMYADPESVNVNELRDGFYEWTATFMMGDNFSKTYA